MKELIESDKSSEEIVKKLTEDRGQFFVKGEKVQLNGVRAIVADRIDSSNSYNPYDDLAYSLWDETGERELDLPDKYEKGWVPASDLKGGWLGT